MNRVLLICGLAVVISQAATAQDTAAVAAGAAARSDVLLSGKIRFKYWCCSPVSKGDFSVRDEVMCFMGTSWSVAKQGQPAPYEASHRGKHVWFVSTPQQDGSVDHKAEVKAEKPINWDFHRLPRFAGSFWA